MRTFRVMFWIEVDAIDKSDAEKLAKNIFKSKKLPKINLYSVEEG